MEEALNNVILERLVADDGIETVAANLVEAACQGPEALARVVGSGSALLLVKPQLPVHTPAPPTVGAYLTKLKVAGFRGIGTTATLDVSPGPGLTLVVGRNGSGKSSFAEAFEVLVTGKCARWRGRPVWEDGWRNLHHSSGQTSIEATFVTEGASPMTVARSWKTGGALAEVEVTVRGPDRPGGGFDLLRWQEASGAFRPFLSHSELSSLLDEPSRLYDQLKSILGLEELTSAVRNLSEQKKQLRDRKKEVAEELAALKQTLQACSDPRGTTCLGALAGKKWKLDAIEQIVLGAAATDETQLAVLRAVAQLAVPDMEEVVRVADRLRLAVQEERRLSATAASRNDALVALLEQALQYQVSHGGDCPVCEAPLASSWADNARRRAAEAGEGAEKLRAARWTVAVEHANLKQLVVPVPKELRQAIELGIGEAALGAWTAWTNIPALPEAATDHIDAHLLPLIESVRALNEVATTRIRSMDDGWRPVALQVGAWLTRARRVEQNQVLLAGVERAEEWLSKAEAAMRDERFAPIATQAQAIWKTLRQQSNVDLASVKLEGKATRRHVTLNVTVDGADSIAVSVMSQGELNALALSLFLPRMTLSALTSATSRSWIECCSRPSRDVGGHSGRSS